MEYISTPLAPIPAGHYSQAVRHGNMLFVSGQLPIDPETRQPVTGTIEEQFLRTMDNVRAILVAGGADIDKIVKTTVYVTDTALWGDVNRLYAAYFGDHKPARAIIPCGELHYGVLLEIEAIAIL